MALIDWIFVALGAAIAAAGGWIQLHPQRLYPRQSHNWQPDPEALKQIRLLGSCFLFMGVFFTVQMTIDLVRLPWWTGTLGGVAASLAAVILVKVRLRQQLRQHSRMQPTPSEKALEESCSASA